MASTTILGQTLTLSPVLLTALRIAPLLSTTASMTHAYMELVTTTSFIDPAPTTSSLSKSMLKDYKPTSSPLNCKDVAAAKEIVAPVWFVNFFNKAVWSVIGLNSFTLLSGSANLWLFPYSIAAIRKFYLVGLAAAFGHYLFVPLVAPSVERLFKICAAQERGEVVEKRGKSAVGNVAEWVTAHKARMSTVDLVAWASFAIGALRVLTP